MKFIIHINDSIHEITALSGDRCDALYCYVLDIVGEFDFVLKHNNIILLRRLKLAEYFGDQEYKMYEIRMEKVEPINIQHTSDSEDEQYDPDDEPEDSDYLPEIDIEEEELEEEELEEQDDKEQNDDDEAEADEEEGINYIRLDESDMDELDEILCEMDEILSEQKRQIQALNLTIEKYNFSMKKNNITILLIFIFIAIVMKF
jgi:hypothetical protein